MTLVANQGPATAPIDPPIDSEIATLGPRTSSV